MEPPQCLDPQGGGGHEARPRVCKLSTSLFCFSSSILGEGTRIVEGWSGSVESLPPRCHLSPTPPVSPASTHLRVTPLSHATPQPVSLRCPAMSPFPLTVSDPFPDPVPSLSLHNVPVPVAAAPQEPHDLPGCLVLLEGEEGAPGGNGGEGEDPSVPSTLCPQCPSVPLVAPVLAEATEALLDEHGRASAPLESLLLCIAPELALDQDGGLRHPLEQGKLGGQGDASVTAPSNRHPQCHPSVPALLCHLLEQGKLGGQRGYRGGHPNVTPMSQHPQTRTPMSTCSGAQASRAPKTVPKIWVPPLQHYPGRPCYLQSNPGQLVGQRERVRGGLGCPGGTQEGSTGFSGSPHTSVPACTCGNSAG